jgi:hypothetical protein
MWPFNTGDCLIEVTALAGLTVYIFIPDARGFSFCRSLHSLHFVWFKNINRKVLFD